MECVCVCVCVCVHACTRMLAHMHVQATQSYSLSEPSAVGRLPVMPRPPCPPPIQTLPAHGGPLASGDRLLTPGLELVKGQTRVWGGGGGRSGGELQADVASPLGEPK